MSNDLIKQALLSLLPEGSAWNVKEDGSWDKTLDGSAENWEYVRAELDKLSEVRNPRTTALLSDLEREYGIITDATLSDAVRRDRLASIIYAPDGVGSASYLQARLRESGFDVYVHSNDPAVDPVPYLDHLKGAQLGEADFQLGEDLALLGSYASELIVAGEIARNEFDFTATCGNPQITCGSAVATCGAATFDISPVEYPDPTDPNRWRFVFFIGGAADRPVPTDGDMERSDTLYWPQVGSGGVAKSGPAAHSGALGLAMVNASPAGTGVTYTWTEIISKITGPFTIDGWAQGRFSTTPTIRQSSDPLVLGSVIWSSPGPDNTWINFNFTVDPLLGRYIQFTPDNDDFPAFVYWDDIIFDVGNIGAIQSIASAQVAGDRRDEFLRTVLKWKPMHTWGIALIEWT